MSISILSCSWVPSSTFPVTFVLVVWYILNPEADSAASDLQFIGKNFVYGLLLLNNVCQAMVALGFIFCVTLSRVSLNLPA